MAVTIIWAAACGEADPGPMAPPPVQNRGPQAVGTIPAQTVAVGETATVDVSPHFSDPDGDALSYTAVSSNANIAGASVTGASVLVNALARGVATITVTARDPRGLLAQQRFEVTVPNRAPEVADAMPARTLFAGQDASVDASVHFRDPDGDPLTYAATSTNPDVASVTVSAERLTIRALGAGATTVTVTASDPDGAGAEQHFLVTVPNRGPEAVGTLPPRTLAVGEAETVDVSSYFRDPDGDSLTYAAASSNTGVATVSVSGGSVTLTALAKGAVTVTVTARDPRGLAAQQRFQVMVPNRGPEAVGTLPSRTLPVGETETVAASSYFSDPDGDALTYAAVSSDTGVATVSVKGDTVAVTALARGVATVTVTARDPEGAEAEQPFRVTVPNRGPEAVGEIPAQTVSAGETATVEVSSYFSDPDGDPLTYTAASSNAGVAAVSVSGDSVTVTALARGVVTVTVTARDPQGLAAQQRFGVTVPNRAPETVGEIPAQSLLVDESVTVDVSSYFSDPEGDRLTYNAASSDPAVAGASVTGSSVTLTALARGVVTVTVTASDPAGLSAALPFDVTVVRPEGDPFGIELVFATSVTRAQEAAFRRATELWMAILAPTELPDLRINRTVTCGGDPIFARYVDMIDDLIIVAAVQEIDGPGGTLGSAGPCLVRTSNSLPIYGRMRFDAADLERLERSGALESVILHEMGHVLGIGTLWGRFGLLRNPASETFTPDTHFTGRRAIAAFDEAGGAGYRGAKVPVENMGGPGTRNGHWRESVLVTELMTGYLNTGVSEPLSAITIQSLVDLGYEVDVTLADPYRLPGADAARALEEAPRIPYGDDIWRGPLVFVDPDGRVVRVIPGPDDDVRRRD